MNKSNKYNIADSSEDEDITVRNWKSAPVLNGNSNNQQQKIPVTIDYEHLGKLGQRNTTAKNSLNKLVKCFLGKQ